jgi:hypothetical protein
MTERGRFMARQPGFISVSLHRSLDGRRIVNYILCVPKTLTWGFPSQGAKRIISA